jgi:hypothetical protein
MSETDNDIAGTLETDSAGKEEFANDDSKEDVATPEGEELTAEALKEMLAVKDRELESANQKAEELRREGQSYKDRFYGLVDKGAAKKEVAAEEEGEEEDYLAELEKEHDDPKLKKLFAEVRGMKTALSQTVSERSATVSEMALDAIGDFNKKAQAILKNPDQKDALIKHMSIAFPHYNPAEVEKLALEGRLNMTPRQIKDMKDRLDYVVDVVSGGKKKEAKTEVRKAEVEKVKADRSQTPPGITYPDHSRAIEPERPLTVSELRKKAYEAAGNLSI